MGWGAAAQQLLALEGLEVLEIPWPTILAVFVGSAVVGLFAALVPAFRAGRMNVLNAIADGDGPLLLPLPPTTATTAGR